MFKLGNIAIVGPTSSGKSDLAVNIARRIQGTIVNGDPFQSYKEIPIGTGQPDQQQLDEITHVGYGVFDLKTELNPIKFGACVQSWLCCNNPILVTGSGFYLKGIWGTLAALPDIPKDVSHKVHYWARLLGSNILYKFLKVVDPVRASNLHYNDSFRIERALSIYLATGCKASDFLSNPKTDLPPNWRVLLVLPSSAYIYNRIVDRIKHMFNTGWHTEVEKIRQSGLEAEIRRLRPIGYNILLDKNIKDVENKIVHATTAYARRQSTFFRNQWPQIPIWNPEIDSLDIAFKLLEI